MDRGHGVDSVLCHAGLIDSYRDRNRMLYLPTTLGLALLDTNFGIEARS